MKVYTITLGQQEILFAHANLFDSGINDNVVAGVLPLSLRRATRNDLHGGDPVENAAMMRDLLLNRFERLARARCNAARPHPDVDHRVRLCPGGDCLLILLPEKW